VRSRATKVGLTGQIGAGKSTVAAVFRSKGAAIIDADAIGKSVVTANPPLLRRLTRAFGKEILHPSGSLNRGRLASLAFASSESTSKLNGLVHPYLLRELRRQIKHFSRSHRVIVVDAALLHLWRLEREMEFTIVVSTPRAERLDRMKIRGISRADAQRRDRTQLSLVQMKRRSDVVLRNHGSKRDLQHQALRIWQEYIAPYVDR